MPDIPHHGSCEIILDRDRKLVRVHSSLAGGFIFLHCYLPDGRPAVGIPAPWLRRGICHNRNSESQDNNNAQSTPYHTDQCVEAMPYKYISAKGWAEMTPQA